jgi:succinate dehydrogenase / fumarate reductase, iron-sulfur subunit
MKITIKRDGHDVAYDVDLHEATLLEVLTYIKREIDTTLSFTSSCKSGVCGSCAMRVNQKEVLACTYRPKEGDIIEPLRNVPLIRDLAVDMEAAYSTNKRAKAWLTPLQQNKPIPVGVAKQSELQSDCILCGACYSACPVYAVNQSFLGPFALTRAWRYVSDARQEDISKGIDAVQTSGIYDCTLCNECVPVCPQEIAPKEDIVKLRAKSGTMGYMDPNFMGGFSGGLTF